METFYNNYDVVVVQFILRLAEFEKYAVLVNLCILESCFKLLENYFKLLEKGFTTRVCGINFILL